MRENSKLAEVLWDVFNYTFCGFVFENIASFDKTNMIRLKQAYFNTVLISMDEGIQLIRNEYSWNRFNFL